MFAKNKIIIDNSIILALSFLSVEHLRVSYEIKLAD